MLSCSTFGSDPNTLLKILSTIVLPTIDYASIIYSSASRTNLKMLESIQNTGIRLSIGAFRTSPASSLQILSSCPPLHLRRLKYLLTYTLKIFSLQNHPLYSKITNRTKIIQFQSKSPRYYPLYVNALQEFDKIISKYTIDLRYVDNIILPDTPPWCFSHIDIDFSLAYCCKRDMTPTEIQQRYLELIHRAYPEHHYFFTDGSVNNKKAGFAIFGQNISKLNRIQDYSSIYTSELLAIESCIENLTDVSQNILIISDSKSALQGIQDPFSTNVIVNRIRERITHLTRNKVSFLWIPSHLNIKGNEIVDTLAKNALEKTISIEYKYNPSDYKQFIRKYIFDLWNDLWKNEQAKLYKIQKNIIPKFLTPILPRKDWVKLTRLRIGHCLFSHRHVIEKNPPPLCQCGEQLEVIHIFNDCRSLRQQ